ncbi:MAG TPA: S1 RNA-binding domain-containing protein, partial [Gemmatimonadaceae bacterium]|nr:S1 RNA-binding domain-containing protein [Gemmatimonadaceae bacterium]
MPGSEGLLHVSEMRHTRVEKPEDVVKKGDRVTVKLIDRDERGRLRLSMKALLPKPEGMSETPAGDGGEGGEGGGDRGGDRGERGPRRERGGDRGGDRGRRGGRGGVDR